MLIPETQIPWDGFSIKNPEPYQKQKAVFVALHVLERWFIKLLTHIHMHIHTHAHTYTHAHMHAHTH